MKSQLSRVFLTGLMIAFSVAGCSELDVSPDPSIGDIEWPPYQKGVSSQDFENAKAVFQQVLHLDGIDRQSDLNLIEEVFRDIEEHADLPESAAASELRSPYSSYVTMVRKLTANCTLRKKAEKNAEGTLTITHHFYETTPQAENVCGAAVAFTQRVSNARYSRHESVDKTDQDSTVAFANSSVFKPLDLLSLSTHGTSVEFARSATDRYRDSGTLNKERRVDLVLGFKNGTSTVLKAKVTENNILTGVDSSFTRKDTRRTLTLVFLGTPNPLVFQKTIADNGNEKRIEKIVLNDVVLFETKPKAMGGEVK